MNSYRTWLEHRSVIRTASACTSVFRFELRPSWFPLRTTMVRQAAAATPSPTRRMKTTFTATAEAFALSSISAPAYPAPINSEFHSATPNIVATRKFRGWARKSPAMAGAIKRTLGINCEAKASAFSWRRKETISRPNCGWETPRSRAVPLSKQTSAPLQAPIPDRKARETPARCRPSKTTTPCGATSVLRRRRCPPTPRAQWMARSVQGVRGV
jgi:hypothetical protein